jgi:hypothetical protein
MDKITKEEMARIKREMEDKIARTILVVILVVLIISAALGGFPH